MISHIEDGSSEMSYEKILVLIREYMVNASEYLDLNPTGIEDLDKRIKEISTPDLEGLKAELKKRSAKP